MHEFIVALYTCLICIQIYQVIEFENKLFQFGPLSKIFSNRILYKVQCKILTLYICQKELKLAIRIKGIIPLSMQMMIWLLPDHLLEEALF